jgi:penicillin-binding protein 1A
VSKTKKSKKTNSKQNTKTKKARKTISDNFRKLMRFGFIAGCVVAFLGFVVIGYYYTQLPDMAKLFNTDKHHSITIRSQDGNVLANYGDIYGQSLTYERFPSHLIDAVVATEDRKFFQHFGIDIFGIIRAFYVNRISGRVVQGGSTITQQLAKIAFFSPEQTYKRKIQEILMALRMENIYTKEEIITFYLNRAYFGKGNYGVDAAAKYYFGKYAEDLDLYESAVLAGILKAPSRYSPMNNPELSLQRAKQVLYNMHNAGFIAMEEVKNALPPQFMERGRARGALDQPYYTDYVLDEVSEILGPTNQDIEVYTTFNIGHQQHLEAVFAKYKDEADKRKASQAAGIIMRPAGAITAMMGGFDYGKSQFNRATSAIRQTGSSFKLYVYLAALENGYKPDDYLVDEPIAIGKWKPRNFSRKYLGRMTLEDAFAKSINTITVKLSEDVDRAHVINMARRLGAVNEIPDQPSIALGAADMTLLELTQGYANIANKGKMVVPYAVTKITTKENQLIYQRKQPKDRQVLNPEVVTGIRQLLRAAVLRGTARKANIKGLLTYAKSGTSQNFKDAAFIGFTDDLVVGIRLGNDDNSSMDRITGGTLPASMWRDLVNSLYYVPINKEQETEVETKGRVWRLFDFFKSSNGQAGEGGKTLKVETIDDIINKSQEEG